MADSPEQRAYAEELDAGDPLAPFRDRFELTDPHLIYLNGNSLGALPKATAKRIGQLVREEWGTALARSWEHWTALPRRAGDAVGVLLGAAPGQVVVGDSTTVNLYKLACAALGEFPGRNVIVTDDDNFPSDRYVLEGIAAKHGYELRMIRTDMNEGISAQAVREAVDSRTALVSLSHVSYRSGAIADMAGITRIAHDSGALILWDLCHSAGAVEAGLDAAGADLAVGCSYKYLDAGPGSPAFLYVAHALQDRLSQPIWGWFGQRDQFAMGPGYDPAPGIGQFLTGTPQIIGVASVEEGARLLAEAGVGRIREKGIRLTSYLVSLADAWLAPLGVSLASPRDPARRGSHVTLSHPQAQRIVQDLAKANVITDYRTPDRFRFGLAALTTRFTDVWDAIDRTRHILHDLSERDVAPPPATASA
ncbi:MAG: kynureninase [Streptosporangiaceae bacterium]|nr:kynureninase [Streptosporangiaceae bacterium]MBV9855534.1 kynureninase [Streptosporangiaceae bacterium]